MTKNITIHYLKHDNYLDIFLHFINRLKSENKSKVKLLILQTGNQFKTIDTDIEYEIINFPNDRNYNGKITTAVNCGTKYSIRIGDDCFLGNHLLDYMIENINILDDEKSWLIAPMISNNIPTCDMFIEGICSQEEKESIYRQFLKTQLNRYGEWRTLTQCIRTMEKWNPDTFYQAVESRVFQDVHPIRYNFRAQEILVDSIIENVEKVFAKRDYSLIENIRPFWTNDIFAIKTEDWAKASVRKLLRKNSADEKGLNDIAKQENRKIFFIKNGFAIHTLDRVLLRKKRKEARKLEEKLYNGVKEKLCIQ